MSDGEPDWPSADEGWTDIGYLTDEPLAVTDLAELQREIDAFISYMCDPEAEPRAVFAIEELYGVRH